MNKKLLLLAALSGALMVETVKAMESSSTATSVPTPPATPSSAAATPSGLLGLSYRDWPRLLPIWGTFAGLCYAGARWTWSKVQSSTKEKITTSMAITAALGITFHAARVVFPFVIGAAKWYSNDYVQSPTSSWTFVDKHSLAPVVSVTAPAPVA